MIGLLACDPGLNKPGAALFIDRLLVASARVPVDKAWASLDVAERANRVARNVFEWACSVLPPGAQIAEYAYERPKVYDKSKSRVDPKDLFAILAVAAALGGMLARFGVTASSYEPHDIWGSVPKSTLERVDPRTTPRGIRIVERLDPETELPHLVLKHDAFDACGIGLKKLERFEPRRVYPGTV